MAFKRQPEHEPEHLDNPNTHKPAQIVPEQQPEQTDDLRSTLTKTDKTFYDRAMKDFNEPYYRFNGQLRKLKCSFCAEVFSTNLSLNRYCTYQHYSQATDSITK